MPDPQQVVGYDPATGKAVIGYKPDTGEMVFADAPQTKAPIAGRGTGYNPANGPANANLAVNALPAVGGAIGGAIGGAGGTVAGFGVGGVPGAIGGAAAGGATGEAIKQLINRFRGSANAPTSGGEAATGIAESAALNAGAEAVGQGVAAGASAAAPWLMRNAVKPIVEKTAAGMAKSQAIVSTLLKDGITVSKSGLDKLQGLFDATNDELKAAIADSKATIDPTKVASRLQDTSKKFATQVNPESDLAAVAQSGDEFSRNPAITQKPQTRLLPVLGGDGKPVLDARGLPVLRPQPVLTPSMTVQDAQAIKQGTYRVLASKYGEAGSAATEAQKALARGLKEEIAQAVPETSALNARESELMNAQQAVTRRVLTTGNQNPLGISAAAHSPILFMASLLDRSPAVKSLLARGLYKSAAVAGGTTETAIRMALTAIAQSEDKDQQP